MKNKYLKEIGIKTSKKKVIGAGDAKDSKNFKKQRKKYGFDARECYNLDYTFAVWLYSHLKMYLESAETIVDLSYHTFDIPVLYETDRVEWKETDKTWYEEKTETHTQKECIDLCIEYLKDYLESTKNLSDDTDENIINEGKGLEKGICSIKIFAELFPSMWW